MTSRQQPKADWAGQAKTRYIAPHLHAPGAIARQGQIVYPPVVRSRHTVGQLAPRAEHADVVRLPGADLAALEAQLEPGTPADTRTLTGGQRSSGRCRAILTTTSGHFMDDPHRRNVSAHSKNQGRFSPHAPYQGHNCHMDCRSRFALVGFCG